MLQDQGAELALAVLPTASIVRALHCEVDDLGASRLWLGYTSGAGSRFAGFLVTASDDLNDLIAFCPLSADLIVGGTLWRLEMQRQWRLATAILGKVEGDRADVVWLRNTGRDLREVPVWLFSLECVPVVENWDGRLQHPQPFCPALFKSMAQQPAASRWIVKYSKASGLHST